jgi:hypothetical protein
MKTVLVLFGLLAAPFPDLSQKLDVVPAALELKGKPVAAARWSDKLGVNVVVLTESARVGEASGGSKQLYGHHFVQKGAEWRQLWRIADAVTDCEFDLHLEVVRASLSITDLDGDGTAESTFAYELTCTSDVSPSTLKVLMHEGEQKFALRGTTRVQVGADDKGKPEYEGGDRKPDPAFAQAPKEFLAHAQKVFDQSGGKK